MNHHPAVRKRTNKVVALVAAAALSVVGGMSLAGCSADNKAPSEADSTQSEESTEGTATDELGGTLQIYAAASLKGAFDTLVEEFSAEHPNLTVSHRLRWLFHPGYPDPGRRTCRRICVR